MVGWGSFLIRLIYFYKKKVRSNYESSWGVDGKAAQCSRKRITISEIKARERFLVCAITVAERQMSFMFVITLHIKATAAINEAFVTSVAALHAPVMHIIRGKCNVGNH